MMVSRPVPENASYKLTNLRVRVCWVGEGGGGRRDKGGSQIPGISRIVKVIGAQRPLNLQSFPGRIAPVCGNRDIHEQWLSAVITVTSTSLSVVITVTSTPVMVVISFCICHHCHGSVEAVYSNYIRNLQKKNSSPNSVMADGASHKVVLTLSMQVCE